MRNAIWNAGRKLMLGTALIAGLLGTGAVAANAAPREYRGPVGRDYGRGFERPVVRGYGRGFGYGYAGPGFGVAVGGPVVGGYIPPCPGDGYVWLGGAWVFRGRPEVARGYGYGYGRDGRFDRGYARGNDRGRGFDRGYAARR
jgi:hypothetical protein